jgi:hypothetical protein
MGLNPGCTLCDSIVLPHQLPDPTTQQVNLYHKHTKGKPFKACISESKAHWMKGQNTCLFIFCWNHQPKSDDLFLWVISFYYTYHLASELGSLKMYNIWSFCSSWRKWSFSGCQLYQYSLSLQSYGNLFHTDSWLPQETLYLSNVSYNNISM